MAKFFDNLFGQRDEDEGFVDYEDADYDTASSAVTEDEAYASQETSRFGKKSGSNRIINMSSTGSKLAILIPTSYEEVMQDAVADLKDNAIVILNLERVNADARMRIVDFMAGVVAVIEGKMKKIASCSYAVAPKNVDWINDLEDYGV